MQKKERKMPGLNHDLRKNDIAIRLNNGQLDIIDVDIKFDKKTKQLFRYGKIEYGLYQRDHIPYILIKIAEMKFDYHVNAFDLIPTIERKNLQWYEGKANFRFLYPRTFTEMIHRRFTFNAHFVEHLKSCLRLQWQYYPNEEAVINKMNELEEYLVTADMFAASKLYEIPPIEIGRKPYRLFSKQS